MGGKDLKIIMKEIKAYSLEEFKRRLKEEHIYDISELSNAFMYNNIAIVFNNVVTEAFVQKKGQKKIYLYKVQYDEKSKGFLQGRERIYIEELFEMNFWKKPNL